MSPKPTKRNPHVPPDCPPGLSAELQESWANWWKHSPLAPQLDAEGIAELRHLWALYGELEHLDEEFESFLVGRWVRQPAEAHLIEQNLGLVAIIERWDEVCAGCNVLEDLFLMNPKVRANREAGDLD